MNVIMSMHNTWVEKILNGTKTLEFRNNIGNEFKIGTIVYLYESSKNKGRKKIIGEFTIKDIKKIENSPLGCYPFLQYYCKNILKDENLAEQIQKIYNIKLINHTDVLKMKYIFMPEWIEKIDRNESGFDFFHVTEEELKNYREKSWKSQMLCENCDSWLKKIGYYNEYDEICYRNFIEIEKPIQYELYLELSDFKNQNGDVIMKAPQSWCYANKK